MESDRDSTTGKIDGGDPEKAVPAPRQAATRPRFGGLLAFLSVLGLLFLSYLLGAAAMFYQFPSSGFLSKAFLGARAWIETRVASTQPAEDMSPIAAWVVDQPGKTFDGFTLYACASLSTSSTQVLLIDMNREVVHRWSISFSKIWPNPPQLEGRQIDDSLVCIFACHLYSNGDLLVVFHGLERNARGYGLAKLDKHSNVVWSYSANVHHDVVVGEDGTIYTIVQRLVNERPKGLEFVYPPWLVDYLVILSPDGKELKKPISILDALRNSPYSTLLSPLENHLSPSSTPALNDQSVGELRQRQDVLHTNSVRVLTRAMASKFPSFKAGQVLISMRHLSAIAVLDPATGSAVWGTCGPWRVQHDVQFLENGRLLMFDNTGSPRGSRVLEYDPLTGAFPWSYPGVDNVPFFSSERGMCQRLPNGNTLIVDSEEAKMIEVTQSKKVVWTCFTHDFITTARRYSPDQLSFLKVGQGPRS